MALNAPVQKIVLLELNIAAGSFVIIFVLLSKESWLSLLFNLRLISGTNPSQSGDGIGPCQFPSWDPDGPVVFHHVTNQTQPHES